MTPESRVSDDAMRDDPRHSVLVAPHWGDHGQGVMPKLSTTVGGISPPGVVTLNPIPMLHLPAPCGGTRTPLTMQNVSVWPANWLRSPKLMGSSWNRTSR